MRTKTKPAIFTLIATGLLLSSIPMHSFSFPKVGDMTPHQTNNNYYCQPGPFKNPKELGSKTEYNFLRVVKSENKYYCGYAKIIDGGMIQYIYYELNIPNNAIPHIQKGTYWHKSFTGAGYSCSIDTSTYILPHKCPFALKLGAE